VREKYVELRICWSNPVRQYTNEYVSVGKINRESTLSLAFAHSIPVGLERQPHRAYCFDNAS
jgi:hypothetical protein